MTENTPATPTRQALAIKGRSAVGRVTGKLRVAIEKMVFEGLKRPEAAAAAGLSDHGLRQALRKPHVKAAYMSELQVLRDSERARNVHALVDVRDGDNQMARVQAVKQLENPGGESGISVNVHIQAGYVIDLSESTDEKPMRIVAGSPRVIEHEPSGKPSAKYALRQTT